MPTSPVISIASVPGPLGRRTSSRPRSAGHVGSVPHSPRISVRSGAGLVERRRKTTIGGSSSIPFGSSRSQRANQRTISGTRSMCGPGIDVAGDMWLHGPISTRRGQRHRLVSAERDVRVPVGPAGDDHRRALDPLVARPERAVPPVRPVGLLLEPAQEPGLGAFDPAQPLVPPALAVDRGGRREDVAGRHVDLPVDEVERLEHAAHVVDVVGVAVVRGVDRDDRPERGRALHRDLERVEASPGGAVHPDASRRPLLGSEPGDRLDEVGLLLRRVLVDGDPLGGARAAEVDPADREPALLADPSVLLVVGRRQVVHPVGERLDHDRRRERLREEEPRRQPHAVRHRDPHVAVLHGAILGRPLGSPDRGAPPHSRAGFAPRAGRGLRAIARAARRSEPRGTAPGNAVGRRLARGDRRARARGLDRDDLAGGGRRPRPVSRRHRARGRRPRLPLAPALPLPPLVQDRRLCARAVRGARAPRAAPPGDRPRRPGLLPGVLGARRGERSRGARDRARASSRTGSSSAGTRSGRRARGSPTGSTSPCAPTRPSPGIAGSPSSSRRSTRPGSRCGAFLRSAAATCARSSSTRSRSRARTSSASCTVAGRCSWGRSTSSGSRPRSSARSPGSWTRSTSTSSRPITADAKAWERVARLRGELAAGRLLSLRAARLLDRGEPASAASAMAKLAGARLAQRLAREAIDLLGLDGLRDGDLDAPLRGRAAALYRASVGSTISGGTTEVQQLVIARRGLVDCDERPARRNPGRRVCAVRRGTALRRPPRRSRRGGGQGRASRGRRLPPA